MLKSKEKKDLQEINEKLEEMSILIAELKMQSADIEGFKSAFHTCTAAFKDIRETLTANIYRVQSMMNELKGVVTMSRAALDEGRKFTEFLELPRLIKAWSEDYHSLSEKVHQVSETVYQLKELKNTHIALDSLLDENQKLRKELHERRV